MRQALEPKTVNRGDSTNNIVGRATLDNAGVSTRTHDQGRLDRVNPCVLRDD